MIGFRVKGIIGIIGYMLGLYRDTAKENGNSHIIGLYRVT